MVMTCRGGGCIAFPLFASSANERSDAFVKDILMVLMQVLAENILIVNILARAALHFVRRMTGA